MEQPKPLNPQNREKAVVLFYSQCSSTAWDAGFLLNDDERHVGCSTQVCQKERRERVRKTRLTLKNPAACPQQKARLGPWQLAPPVLVGLLPPQHYNTNASPTSTLPLAPAPSTVLNTTLFPPSPHPPDRLLRERIRRNRSNQQVCGEREELCGY